MTPFLVFGKPEITSKDIASVQKVLKTGWIGLGPRVAAFEEAFRKKIGCRYAVATNSCTAALHLALLSLEIGEGAEVITTPMTFCATVNAILHARATPVFVDIHPESLTINPEEISKAITRKTRAILPVHLYGAPCEMGAIGEIARRRHLHVVEDAAHALGAKINGRFIGRTSEAACFSFYPTKNITTIEGGMLCAQSSVVAERAKRMRLHGLSKDAWRRYSGPGIERYRVESLGFKYNMTDVQAALGLSQLPRLDRFLAKRKRIWEIYDRELSHLPWLKLPPSGDSGSVHARHLYTVLVQGNRPEHQRRNILRRLHLHKIGAGIHYTSLHLEPYYRRRFGFRPEDFPNALDASRRTLSLPLSNSMTLDDARRVVRILRAIPLGL